MGDTYERFGAPAVGGIERVERVLTEFSKAVVRKHLGGGGQEELLRFAIGFFESKAGSTPTDGAPAAARRSSLRSPPQLALVLGADSTCKRKVCAGLVERAGGTLLSVQQLIADELVALEGSEAGDRLLQSCRSGQVVPAAEQLALLLRAMQSAPPPWLLIDFPRSADNLVQLEAAAGRVGCALHVGGDAAGASGTRLGDALGDRLVELPGAKYGNDELALESAVDALGAVC
jgi:hypothetical protein